jgi:hypothetical protein
LVRYLVGTVVGALVVAFFVASKHSPFQPELAGLLDLGDSQFLGVGLAAAAGFAYCYVASAPVLTFHALRAQARWEALKSQRITAVIAAPLLCGGSVYAATPVLPPAASWLFGIVSGIQLLLVALSVANNFKSMEKFYRTLAERRATATAKKEEITAGSEYITSYRHLREHGNAFLILLMEVVLAYSLYSLGCSHVAAAPFLLGAWLVPAAFAWFIGCVLEGRLVARAV